MGKPLKKVKENPLRMAGRHPIPLPNYHLDCLQLFPIGIIQHDKSHANSPILHSSPKTAREFKIIDFPEDKNLIRSSYGNKQTTFINNRSLAKSR